MIEQETNTSTQDVSTVRQLNILHAITINGIGGAEKHLVYLLPALQQQLLSITCLILYRPLHKDKAENIGSELVAQGILVYYQPYTRVFSRKTLSFLKNFISQQLPDLIHSHLKHTDLWLAYLKQRGQIQPPVVATIHGYRDAYHNQNGLAWKPNNKRTLYYWLSRFAGTQLDGFLSISNGITEFFSKSGMIKRKKIYTVHHGTPLGSAATPIGKKPWPDLVIIGRLVKFKGHEYAIEAVRILREKYPDVRLHIYGIGPEEPALKAQAASLSDAVFFHGFVNDIHNVLAQHSIALLPSVGEPFGLVFFDAFKAGLPVVAFDVAAVNEIILHNVNGLLAAPLNAADLAQQVEKLLQDEAVYQRLAAAAVERMRKEFSLEKMANDYKNFYLATINRNAAR